MSDQIIIEGMRIMSRVGVPDEERSRPQPLEISLRLHLDLAPAARSEQLCLSVDYAQVHQHVVEVVQQRPRSLIETVAEDIAVRVLGTFNIQRVDVEVRKFILENTRSVGVWITRSRSAPDAASGESGE